jgi:cell division protein FtsW (lipid II flippase)
MLPVSKPAFHTGLPAHRRVREKVPGASRNQFALNRSRPSFQWAISGLICSRTDSRGIMTHRNHLVLSLLTQQLPQLLVCLVALILILVRWKHAPRSSVWALLGFGLALLLCIVRPVLTVEMVMAPPQDRVRWSLILGLSQIALEVMIYTFLLVAILIGRSKSDSSNHFAGLPEVHPPPYETRQNTV